MVSWTRLVAAALWTAYLVEMTAGPGWQEVATPTVRWLALAAGLALGGLCLLAARDGIDRSRPAWPGGWAFAIAAVPLFLLVRIGVPGLDLDSAANRPAMAPDGAPTVAADGTVPLDRLAPGPVPVRVQGVLVRPEGRLAALLPPLPDSSPATVGLLRFRIICCAADAVPVAVRVVGIPPHEVTQGGWAEVEGVVVADGAGLLLEARSWTPIRRPARPYLYAAPSWRR